MSSNRPLNRENVIAATFAIVEEKGLGAVSMRSVAARLGVTPMALYRHVGDKQGLLDGLVERLLLSLPLPSRELPWDERLRRLAAGIRAGARRHPEIFLLLFQRPAATREALGPRDAVYDALRVAGVEEALIPRIERALSTLLFGFAASEVGGRFTPLEGPSADAEAAVERDFAWTQEVVLDMIRRAADGA